MKNNHGWGLRAELWICLVLIIFFGIAVILIQKVVNQMNEGISTEGKNNNEGSNIQNVDNNSTNKTINYNNLEDEMIVGAKKYYNKYYLDHDLQGTVTVTVVRLKTEEIIEPLKAYEVECSGYIEIESSNGDIKYYPYLKCGNLYQTNGYNEVHDNLDL